MIFILLASTTLRPLRNQTIIDAPLPSIEAGIELGLPNDIEPKEARASLPKRPNKGMGMRITPQ
jgi:hypothetical protein